MPSIGDLARPVSALADQERLRLFAHLVLAGEEGLSAEQLRALSPQAPRLAKRLAQGGLVDLAEDGHATACTDAFDQALSQPSDSGVLDHLFGADGRLASMPVRPALRRALLEHLTARMFEPGTSYTEAEINMACRQYWDDYPAMRRYLVEGGHLDRSRDGGAYRVAEAG